MPHPMQKTLLAFGSKQGDPDFLGSRAKLPEARFYPELTETCGEPTRPLLRMLSHAPLRLAKEEPVPPRGCLLPHSCMAEAFSQPPPQTHLSQIRFLWARSSAVRAVGHAQGGFQGRAGGGCKEFQRRAHPAQSQATAAVDKQGVAETPSSRPVYMKAAFSFNIKSYQPNKTCQSYII